MANELNRHTPYHVPHSTAIAGMTNFTGGDDRYYNNIFLRKKTIHARMNLIAKASLAMKYWKPEDITPFTRAFLSYPVGTAVYNDHPGG